MDEFERATPDFLAAARFALFAERLAPYLAELERVATMTLPTERHARLAVAGAKLAAARELPRLRAVLGLEDGNGE